MGYWRVVETAKEAAQPPRISLVRRPGARIPADPRFLRCIPSCPCYSLVSWGGKGVMVLSVAAIAEEHAVNPPGQLLEFRPVPVIVVKLMGVQLCANPARMGSENQDTGTDDGRFLDGMRHKHHGETGFLP